MSPIEEEEDVGLGLNDLLPEPESPPPVPYSFATYNIPEDVFLDRTRIIVRLVGAHPLWGHYLWNTSKVLATFLGRNTSLCRGKYVLELGAGAGVPSIVAALSKARQVVVTDYPDDDLIRNIEYNLDINLPVAWRCNDIALARGHVWGRNISSLILDPVAADSAPGAYDLLLLSDLVFNHSQHPALVASVNGLLAPSCSPSPSDSDSYPTPCILVFITHHRPRLVDADLAFFPLLAASGTGWAYEQVVEEYAGAMFAEDPGEERVRGTVKGWRCWRVASKELAGEKPARIHHATWNVTSGNYEQCTHHM